MTLTRMQRDSAPKPAPPTTLRPSVVRAVLGAPGQPLDHDTRDSMQQRFAHDFSRVQVHMCEQAARSARAVNALAYTVGPHIVFGARQYAPRTSTGRRLIAHELAHVVQQRNSVALQRHSPSEPGDELEREASRAADAVVTNAPVPTLSSAVCGFQRQILDAGAPAPDAGAPAPDAGAPAPDAGTGASATTAATLTGLTAVRTNFKTAGPLDPDNCATNVPAALGVGIGGNASNAMEMTWRIDGTIPPDTEFDITRTVTDTSWVHDGGAWTRILHRPAGTGDDRHDTDECLTPRGRRIFVTDDPGFNSLDPTGLRLGGGVTVSATATAFAIKLSFAEWVIARNRGLGIDWTRISDPVFTFWHSTTSVAIVGGTWSLVNTPSGDPNEIALGSISTAGATP